MGSRSRAAVRRRRENEKRRTAGDRKGKITGVGATLFPFQSGTVVRTFPKCSFLPTTAFRLCPYDLARALCIQVPYIISMDSL